MGCPRKKHVRKGEEGVYHVWNRTVRRAFLFGYDPVANRDYSYRKKWIVEHLKFLGSIFSIDVCSFAIMINHFHAILRTRPDVANSWSDYEVASRWSRLHPNKKIHRDIQIQALLQSPDKILEKRLLLSDLSWFMKEFEEYIARRANNEDEMTGRFWDGRFRSEELLDMAAITCCMLYVDLNPVHAGVALTPEDSDSTSIQERINAWKEHMISKYHELWLCPIQSTPTRRGILDITEKEYIELVDKTGRMIRDDKPGYIDPDLPPILSRIGIIPGAWNNTLLHFDKFKVAAGSVSNLKAFAKRLGQKWVKGISFAKTAFV